MTKRVMFLAILLRSTDKSRLLCGEFPAVLLYALSFCSVFTGRGLSAVTADVFVHKKRTGFRF